MSFEHTLSRTRGRRRPLRAVHLRRPNLRFVIATALLAAGLTAGWMWLRDSALVRVREVQVTGTTSAAESRIRDALQTAAVGMTTLHVREDVLRKAVAQFPSVAGIRTQTDFPHKLTVEVLERHPVAVLASGDQLVAVTGGGLLLRDVGAPDTVPEIDLPSPVVGERVQDPRLLGALQVAGAAPPALARRTTSIQWGPRGLSAHLESGPPLIFGSSAEASNKWAAAARVLADPSAAGALYLDLRIPGRVAAGGLGPLPEVTPATASDPAASGVTATPSPQPQP
jgi:cell division protein FtsQ